LTISARSGYFSFRKVSKPLRQLKTAVTKSLKTLAAAKDSRYEKSQNPCGSQRQPLRKVSKSLRQLKTAVTKSLKIIAAAKDSRYENLNLFEFCRNCQRAKK
jgi:hypothetical protein